jgi:hypothetical protein
VAVHDSDSSQTLVVSLESVSPTLSALNFNSSTKTLSITPANGSAGPYIVNMKVDDGLASYFSSFTLTVMAN